MRAWHRRCIASVMHPPPLMLASSLYAARRVSQALLKHFEARRRVVYIDEYNTSQFCPDCEVRLVPHSNREKLCKSCKKLWNRDVVGALNQEKVWTHWLKHGERPEYLRRPTAGGGATTKAGAAPSAAPAQTAQKRGRARHTGLDPDDGGSSPPHQRARVRCPMEFWWVGRVGGGNSLGALCDAGVCVCACAGCVCVTL